MAPLRLDALAIALIALIGATALAEPSPPSSWREQPTLAGPAASALADSGLTGSAIAWGDPSTGRFALVQDYTSPAPVIDAVATIADVHASLRAELEAAGATIESWQVQRDESRGAYTLGTFRALVRARATLRPDGTLRAQSALCFYNERDRDRSERQCTRFLESL